MVSGPDSTECPEALSEFFCADRTRKCPMNVRNSTTPHIGAKVRLSDLIPVTDAQISPTLPREFVLPNSPVGLTRPYCHRTTSERHLSLVRSGWYYGKMSMVQAQELLANKPLGTFLLRDSSDPRYLYSITVQTDKGPTSIRLHFEAGFFKLDAQPHLLSLMPKFTSVNDLIEYYCAKKDTHIWVDPKGNLHGGVSLRIPLRKGSQNPPSLKNIARLAIHATLQNSTAANTDPTPHKRLDLPEALLTFLDDYPHSV